MTLSSKIYDITKEEFLAAYNQHLPNAWTKFVFKYFSQSTKPENKWLKKIFVGVELSLFGLGMLGAILNVSNTLLAVPTIPFAILLLILGISMFGAFIMNNARINKIRKILGVTIEEYNVLVIWFLPAE